MTNEQKEYYEAVFDEVITINGLVIWLTSISDRTDELPIRQQELFYELLEKSSKRLSELKTDLRKKRVEFGDIDPDEIDDEYDEFDDRA